VALTHSREDVLELYEFASVTYCTNVPSGEFPSDDEAEYVAAQVAELLASRIAESPFAGELGVTRVEFEVGCILTTITIGAVASALYKFVKEYPKFRPGLILLFKDLNGIYVRLKRSTRAGSTYLMREDIPERRTIEAIAEKVTAGAVEPAMVTRPARRRSKVKP
jgi:hypothetical protein